MENVIERSLVMCAGKELGAADIPHRERAPAAARRTRRHFLPRG